ncbi:hypothetical protein DEO72_LG4g248 [Vigna unguiculata]|uniref:Uncharacterized protein n=1 Tax=Vigna unguiculata TaxID=3917 RepID=A0A4D6LMP6_VIGUN|nr:hypothetical protein DEO72_LG4g248 [Vigna unguiculata]
MLDGVFPPFFRLLSHGCLSSIKGSYLLGFTKPVRNQRDLSVISISESSATFSLTFREFQSVEHRLERLSGEYRDGRASSSGIQSHLVLSIDAR